MDGHQLDTFTTQHDNHATFGKCSALPVYPGVYDERRSNSGKKVWFQAICTSTKFSHNLGNHVFFCHVMAAFRDSGERPHKQWLMYNLHSWLKNTRLESMKKWPCGDYFTFLLCNDVLRWQLLNWLINYLQNTNNRYGKAKHTRAHKDFLSTYLIVTINCTYSI